ncbi:MAG: DUF3293 domain-containing protein, partial [Zoogloea sp.]|nr:DUF3293 domain-containing protein [Zoogloea sp.]
MNGAPASSALDKSLIAAYLAAHYRVDCDPPFVMRIGRGSAGLERLYEVFGVRAAAFVTACNPFGVPLGAAANREAQIGRARSE